MSTSGTIASFDQIDCFDLKPFSERLENFIQVEHDYVEGSLVLALNAGFGSGKTTFIEMWRHSLIQKREKGDAVPMPVVINAWESDHCGDPLLAILAGLTETIDQWKGTDAPDKSKIIEAAKDIGWFAFGIVNEVAANWAGFNPLEAEKFAKEKKEKRAPQTPDFITRYRQRVGALKNLKNALKESFGGKAPKLLVFVDELDRCRPDYAVTFLETIKHVFDIPGMVFILAVDKEQLAHSTKALYGNIDFHEYFRKFSHRTIELPTPTQEGLLKLNGGYVKKYIHVEKKRMSMLSKDAHISQRITEIANAFKLKPRQIQEGFRILGHYTQTSDPKTEGLVYWGIGIAGILLCFLKISRPDIFNKILQRNDAYSDICDHLIEKMGHEEATWWIQVLLCTQARTNQERDIRNGYLINKKYIRIGEEVVEFFSDFSQGWGHSSITLQKIASRIEFAQNI